MLESRNEYTSAGRHIWHIINVNGGKLEIDDMPVVETILEIVDKVDQAVYSAADGETRQQLQQAIVKFVEQGTQDTDETILTQDLVEKLTRLRGILRRRKSINNKVAGIVKDIFDIGDLSRFDSTIENYMEHSLEAGRLTSDLLLAILNQTNQRCWAALREIIGLGNLLDDIVDARTDYRKDMISVKPGVSFYVQTIYRALKEALKIFIAYPKKMEAIRAPFIFIKEIFGSNRTKPSNDSAAAPD